MLRKRKDPKRKSVAETLMRDIQGTPAEKLALFEKVKAAGGFANEDPAELKAAEDMRGRKVGIVALARKLAIALWRFVEEGVIPEGATLKV